LTEPHALMTGVVIGESPRWHDDRLWFSDWGAREVVAVDLEGTSEVILRMPAFPFSFDWLPDGRFLIVSGSEGLLLRREPGGSLVTHTDLRSTSGHPWNEIVVDGRGNVYLNNIGFDLMGGGEPSTGTLAVVTPDLSVRQVADGVAFPNGMVVTPDNSTLIVAESYASRLTAFDIDTDGGLSNRRVWAALDGSAPDGICLDVEGAVWYGDQMRCVRVREGGDVLQTIDLDRSCFACMLGGVGHSTLFMMVAEWRGPEHMFDEPRTGQVLSVEAPARGAGWP